MENKSRSIEKAIEILEIHIREIDRVSEWAEVMGYKNPKEFSRLFRNYFGRRPKEVMVEIKTGKAIELLSGDYELSTYEVALEIGKQDEQALFHFIKRVTGKPPKFFTEKNHSKNV